MAQPSVKDYAHANGRDVNSVSNKLFDQYPALTRGSNLQLKSPLLTPVAGAVSTEAVAYFVFLGTTSRKLTAAKVLFNVTVVGSGAQTAGEVGLFSSPLPPNRAAQTLTKIVATGTVDALTGTGIKGNTTAFGTDIHAGTNLWAGYRVVMATDEPTVVGLGADESMGAILSLPAAAAFTATATYAGALIAPVLTWQAPNLVLTCS